VFCFYTLFKEHKRFLVFLFILSLITRFLFYFLFLKNNTCILMFDSGHYHSVATQITRGLGVTNLDGTLHFYRLPGYPFFLALIYKFFGIDISYVLYIQIFVYSFIPILIFLLVFLFFTESSQESEPGCQPVMLPKEQLKTAMCASIISCFDIGYLIFSGLIMSEMFFVLFFILFLIFFWRNSFIISGLLLGCASLVRPVGGPLIVCVLLCVIIFVKDKRIINLLKLFISWACVISIWLIRNYIHTGLFFLHTLSGPHFVNHMAIRLVMSNYNLSYSEAKNYVYNVCDNKFRDKEKALKRALTLPERSFIQESCAYKFMFLSPIKTVKFFLMNIIKTVFSLYSSELLVIDSGGKLPEYKKDLDVENIIKKFLFPSVNNKLIIFIIYLEIFIFIFFILGIFGFLISFYHEIYFVKVFLVFLIFSTLFVTLSLACGFARLRLPIEVFLIMLASRFWSKVFFREKDAV